MSFIYEIQDTIRKLWAVVFYFSHLIGKVLVTTLFFSSAAVLTHYVSKAFGFSIFFVDFHSKVSAIYEEPVAWAATSMIIATTVAIGHMKNLEINELKSSHEQQDRWGKERRARKA